LLWRKLRRHESFGEAVLSFVQCAELSGRAVLWIAAVIVLAPAGSWHGVSDIVLPWHPYRVLGPFQFASSEYAHLEAEAARLREAKVE